MCVEGHTKMLKDIMSTRGKKKTLLTEKNNLLHSMNMQNEFLMKENQKMMVFSWVDHLQGHTPKTLTLQSHNLAT